MTVQDIRQPIALVNSRFVSVLLRVHPPMVAPFATLPATLLPVRRRHRRRRRFVRLRFRRRKRTRNHRLLCIVHYHLSAMGYLRGLGSAWRGHVHPVAGHQLRLAHRHDVHVGHVVTSRGNDVHGHSSVVVHVH